METLKYPLYTLFFEVTSRCNAFCDHCGSRCNSKAKTELSAEDFKKVLDDVAKEFGTKTIMLNITGGEPLMRKDLFEITKHADNLGFKWGLVTNGMLITDEVIQKMKETHMSTITISLDGMKETHENFRHVPGCFDKIINAITKLKEENFAEHIQVTFIATKNNISELSEVYRLLSMIGIDSLRVSGIDPIGRANDNQNLMLDKKDYEYLIDFVRKHENSELPTMWSCSHYFGNDDVSLGKLGEEFHCYTGIHIASVLSNGDIFGCPNIPRRQELIQGNVLKDNFCDVWKNKFEFYRNPNRTKSRKCEGCKHWKYCKGDSFHTYDFEKKVPQFCYRDIFKDEKEDKHFKPSFSGILQTLISSYGVMSQTTISPANRIAKKTVLFTPDATKDMLGYFHYGETHPINIYEQQVALIGNKFGDTIVVRFIVPDVLFNRARNMAVMNKVSMDQILQEVDIINENIPKCKDEKFHLYDGFVEKPKFLGLAHSHPMDTEFRFSINDTKNYNDFVKKYGDFISIILNPQKQKIACFTGRDCFQARLILLSK